MSHSLRRRPGRRNGTGELAADDTEIAVIQRTKRLRRHGASYAAIAERLNAEGIPSRREAWSKSSVWSLVNDHLRSRKAKYIKGSNAAAVQ